MKLSKEEQSHLRGIANGPVFGRRSGDKEGGKGWANGGGRLIGNGEEFDGGGLAIPPITKSAMDGALRYAHSPVPPPRRTTDRGHPAEDIPRGLKPSLKLRHLRRS